MMFTDVEIALAHRHRRDLQAYASQAQDIVDRTQAQLDAALATIRKLEGELAIERARRQSLELKLDRARRG